MGWFECLCVVLYLSVISVWVFCLSETCICLCWCICVCSCIYFCVYLYVSVYPFVPGYVYMCIRVGVFDDMC